MSITLTLSPRFAFNLDGQNFGTHGTLRVNGVVIPTSRWRDDSIKGDKWPDNLPNGAAIVIEGHAILGPERKPTITTQSYKVGKDV